MSVYTQPVPRATPESTRRAAVAHVSQPRRGRHTRIRIADLQSTGGEVMTTTAPDHARAPKPLFGLRRQPGRLALRPPSGRTLMGSSDAGHGFATRWRVRARAASLGETTGGGSVNGAIICGVDDSESAKGAARVARALSSELGLGVVFVNAIAEKAAGADGTAVAERLARIGAGVNGADGGATWSVEVGHPADALIEAANQTEAAMIVVGSTGPRSSLLGSVSADVSRRAPCPVVVVPPGADASVNRREIGGSSRSALHLAGGIARFNLGSVDRDS
jgi:nucleotide-binding universal stress UspA family protein